MDTKTIFCAVLTVLGFFSAPMTPSAHAQQLITNGNFEQGSLNGWTTAMQAGSAGSYFLSMDSFAPESGLPTVGPSAGTFYAVSDSQGPGAQALFQTFTVPAGSPSVIVSFDMFVNDWSGIGPIINPAGLDYTSGPNQYARVDVLTASASAFDIGSGVLQNLYQGVDSVAIAPPNSYTHYVFDLTSLLGNGGTYQLRFAEADTELILNQGIDNVSITVVPEPGLLSLLLSAVAAGSILRYRRRYARQM